LRHIKTTKPRDEIYGKNFTEWGTQWTPAVMRGVTYIDNKFNTTFSFILILKV
jgi:hypothetical protein